MRGNFTTNRNGANNPNYKDGRKNERLYRIYNNMKNRCYNINAMYYKNYGGRGITVCDEWLNDYSTFKNWALCNGYANNLTIDRIDNDESYNPSNCRWVDMKTQSNNKRNNVIYLNKTLQQWCDELGISRRTVADRIKRGWNIEDALFKKVEHKFRGC